MTKMQSMAEIYKEENADKTAQVVLELKDLSLSKITNSLSI